MDTRFNIFKEKFSEWKESIFLILITALSLVMVPLLISLIFNVAFDYSADDLTKVNAAFDKITELSIAKYTSPDEAANYGHSIISKYISNPDLVSKTMWFLIVSSNIPLLISGILFVFIFRKKDDTIFLLKGNRYGHYLQAIFAFFFALPFLSLVGQWNQGLHFPIEEIKNDMLFSEVKSGIIQHCFGDMHSINELLLMILFVGVLTAIAEEFIFRVGLQNILLKTNMNPHIAILVGAAIFSFVHFQFYGFFVRLILGMLLGYLYYWTRDIKTSIIAHAFNNSLAMVVAYNTGSLTENPSDEALGSFVPTAALFTVFCGLSLYRIYQMRKEENITTL